VVLQNALNDRHEVARQMPREQRREQQSVDEEHQPAVAVQSVDTQKPLRQVRPVQQPEPLHDDPMGPQPSTQRLRLHRPLQHWPLETQELPVATQRVSRQMPIWQLPEQH